MAKHLIVLAAVSLVVIGIYARVTGAYFCAYDDFIEIHRAAFEDSQEPSRMFTTSHFNSYKYRPLNRAVTLMTYWGGDGDPMVFRIRNLSFHLVNVGLVYALGWLLFKSPLVSSVGAALFGLHPLANQTTIGAVWPNTMAHTWFLLASVLLLTSIRRKPRTLWLIGSAVSAWLSLLMYDTAITVFGVMCVYLAAQRFITRERFVDRQLVIALGSVSGVLVASYFVLRHLFAPRDWEQVTGNAPAMGVVMKNLAMYLVALLSPVDAVFANEVLHFPLPSEIVLSGSTAILWGVATLLVGVGVVVVLWGTRRDWPNVDWAAVVFLIAGMFLPLLPVLSFSGHPSETYLYLPVAFYGLLVSYGLATTLLVRAPRVYVSTVLLLILVFGAATSVRNERVVECASTAHRIIRGLQAELNGDISTVALANVPGEPASRRYGFYGFRGVDTIGHREMANRAVTSALQLLYKNESVKGEVVEAGELINRCGSRPVSGSVCLWVHWDGRVERVN